MKINKSPLILLVIIISSILTAGYAAGDADPAYVVQIELKEDNLSIADKYNDPEYGNWIALSGGDPFPLPDPLVFSYQGKNQLKYNNISAKLNIEESPKGDYNKVLTYPYSTHQMYTNVIGKNVVEMDFKGETAFANKAVNVYVVKIDTDNISSSISDLKNENANDLPEVFEKNFGEGDYKKQDGTLDENGDIHLEFSGLNSGHYGIFVFLDTTDRKESLMLSATAFEVLQYDSTLETPLAVMPEGIYGLIDCNFEIAGPEASYTYVALLVNNSEYNSRINLGSNGTRAGTNLSMNGARLYENSELLDTGIENLLDMVEKIAGSHASVVKKDPASGEKGNSTLITFGSDGYPEGHYTIFIAAAKSKDDLIEKGIPAFATSQIYFTYDLAFSDLAPRENPKSIPGEEQIFYILTTKDCDSPESIKWYLDGVWVKDGNTEYEDEYMVIAEQGTHYVKVEAKSGSETIEHTWTWKVDYPVEADFLPNETSGYAPLTVKFEDKSINSSSWAWDFGDGEKSTEQSPVHTYSEAENYTVTLNAGNGCWADEKIAYIQVNEAPVPVAEFEANLTEGYAPLTVNFTDLSSNNPTSWAWDFDGDGAIDSTVQNPTHNYTSPGVYTVSLKVVNDYGENTFTEPAYIHVTDVAAPIASFTVTPYSGYVSLEVNFTDTSTGATSWFWDFGDGENSTEINPVHTYDTKGIYTVCLNVSNGYGWDVYSDTITVTVKSNGGSSGGNSGGTGGGVVSGEPNTNVKQKEMAQVYVSAGTTTKMILTDETNDVTYVAFISETNAGKAVIKVEVLNGKHSQASKDPEEEVYRNLNIEISKGIGKKIESGTVGFKVSKQWLAENNINLDTIVLQHYVDGEWVNCLTTKTGEEEENFCFEAEVSSFSPFAITGEKQSIEISPIPEETPGKTADKPETRSDEIKPSDTGEEKKPGSIPGFTSLVGFVAVLLTGMVLLRRNK